jgi:hypothetical protein
MKRISLRLTIALATFFIGVGIVALWFLNRSNSVVDVAPKPHDCFPLYIDNFIDDSDYKGILTHRFYTTNANKAMKRVSDEEANAEATANLFRRFREAPLTLRAACVDESYRLTWIPTFHAPTVIRIWRSDDKYFVVTKRLNGKGGYGLGDLEIEQTRPLTAEEWQRFKNLISLMSYWNMPSKIEEPIPHDGATWTFEGFNDDKFHYVFRISPSDELSQMFKKLFDLTGIETEHERYLP